MASTSEDVSSTTGSTKAPRRPSRRLLVILGVVVALVLSALATAYVGRQALAAKDDLERARAELTPLRDGFGDPKQDLPALYEPVRASTASAAARVGGPVWRVYEFVPWLGPNLRALRQTAQLVDGVVQDGIGPVATAANGLSADSLRPRDGRIQLAPLAKLSPAVVEAGDAIRTANAAAQEIDTTNVLPQVASAVDGLRTQLQEVTPLAEQARAVVPLVQPMLGGDGPRRYLLMFQNNAEERASGGNPASLALVTADNGKVTLGRQASSGDFPSPFDKPPYTPTGPGNEGWPSVYTDYASTYLTNITMTPDFPSTARMAQAMWKAETGDTVDGVISVDPVAVSYLLNATGPIKLAGGTTIDASNALSFLLFEVYAKYAEGEKQDEVFASAARSIFTALINGQGDPAAYLEQLRPIVAQQRLKVWSARPEEQSQLQGSPVGTMMPADNGTATVLGVYNNDDATSKMSFFMRQTIDVTTDRCGATPTHTVKATVRNTLREDQVDSLPFYVKANQKNIPPGGDRQWVQVFGPVGGTLGEVTVDGKPVVWGTNLLARDNTNPDATGMDIRRPAVKGQMYGRPVGVVSITLAPGATATVTAAFTGKADDSPTVTVSHTPQVAETPVTVRAATC